MVKTLLILMVSSFGMTAYAGMTSSMSHNTNVVNPTCCEQCALNGNPAAIACVAAQKSGKGSSSVYDAKNTGGPTLRATEEKQSP